MFPKTVAWLSLLFSSYAFAESMVIPCEGAPASAVLHIPAPAGKFAHIVCTKFGHIVHPTKGWLWNRPGGFRPAFFPSQMVASNPREIGHESYFSSIQSRELGAADTRKRWKVLASKFPENPPPKKSVEIVAINHKGGKHIVRLFSNGWGIGCSPVCNAKGAFMMVHENKQAPTW